MAVPVVDWGERIYQAVRCNEQQELLGRGLLLPAGNEHALLGLPALQPKQDNRADLENTLPHEPVL